MKRWTGEILISSVLVGMALGTAWAVRGQFGHEQGAAWAGSIAAIAIVMISRRPDWQNKLFKVTLAAAIGWGLGGMMSYGLIVGYGRSDDFINVYYGFTMLFVVGGLYGFIGGSLFGLSLTDSKKSRINWLLLLCGMVSSGIVFYFFLVMQWEWLMTPPRSELWAVCLGIACFLTWYMLVYKFRPALRVGALSGTGAGFGFAFGNFLQVLGTMSGIDFNFWNVMEYSLGFFGGLGMCYGTLTSDWTKEESDDLPRTRSNAVALILLVFFIPFVIWNQSFEMGKLVQNFQAIAFTTPETIARWVQLGALVLILFYAGFSWRSYHQTNKSFGISSRSNVEKFFSAHLGFYILLSLLITGALFSTHRIEQYLYIINYLLLVIFLPRLHPEFNPRPVQPYPWSRLLVTVLLVLAILALIASNIHGDMPGMQKRF